MNAESCVALRSNSRFVIFFWISLFQDLEREKKPLLNFIHFLIDTGVCVKNETILRKKWDNFA